MIAGEPAPLSAVETDRPSREILDEIFGWVRWAPD
jgi:hypothetical protein